MTRTPRLAGPARSLIGLYPRAWRARFGDELGEVITQHDVTLFTLLDLLVGAVDAHRHPELLPAEVLSMSTRLRSSLVSILVSAVVFAVAWGAVLSVRDPLPAWLAATVAHPDFRLAIGVVQITGLVALLAIAAGGLPLLGSALRLAARTSDRRVVLPLAIASLAFLAFVGLFVAAVAGWVGPLGDTLGRGVASLLWAAVVLVSVAIGLAAVARAVRHAEPDARVVGLTLRVGAVAVGAMWLGVLSSLALIAAVASEAPDIGAPAAALLPMIAASSWAALALRRGLREVR